MLYFHEMLAPENDHARITAFLRALRDFLGDVLFNPDNMETPVVFFDDEVREAIAVAFEREVFERFGPALDAVAETPMASFQQVGLTATSLRAKLLIVQKWEARLRQMGGRALAFLLKAIDDFLGSLAHAVGGLIIEPLKEGKEMIENSLDYAN